MAKKQDDEPKPVTEEDEESDTEGEEAGDDNASESESPSDSDSDSEGEALKEAAPLAVRSESDELEKTEEGEEAEEEVAAAQLGIDRYVLAGFFASGIIAAYVVGRTLEAVWASFSNRDWFSQAVPRLAGTSDDEKMTYSFILSGIVALILVVRAYRRPDVRAWADGVASELAKVQWPTKKEVYNSTFIVIVASAAATLYLALLDRLWAFVTNIVYGDGS